MTEQTPTIKSKGLVLWFSGLSGSGKTTLALELLDDLRKNNYRAMILDGDVQRQAGGPDHKDGFDREGRRRSMARTAKIAAHAADYGEVVIVSKISPYRDDRMAARDIIGHRRFVLVWLAAPLHKCEARDPKGLYQKARRGDLRHFTGVTDPYEAPYAEADIRLETHLLSVSFCVRILRQLVESLSCTVS